LKALETNVLSFFRHTCRREVWATQWVQGSWSPTVFGGDMNQHLCLSTDSLKAFNIVRDLVYHRNCVDLC